MDTENYPTLDYLTNRVEEKTDQYLGADQKVYPISTILVQYMGPAMMHPISLRSGQEQGSLEENIQLVHYCFGNCGHPCIGLWYGGSNLTVLWI